MHLTFNDWVGFTGVLILLLAYLLNLAGKLSRSGVWYSLLNVIGAGLACLASWLIQYMPFVLLEATWTLVSLVALLRYLQRR